MHADQSEPIRTSLFIGGRRLDTEEHRTIFDPAQPHVEVGQAASASAEQVDLAIHSANNAMADWSSLTVPERARLMTLAVDGLEEKKTVIARVLTREIGKPLHESIVDLTVFLIRWNLALAMAPSIQWESELEPHSGLKNRTLVQHQPLGLVTIIIPFNWPPAILAASLPQALLTGNTVIVKPAKTAPLATTLFLESIAAKLPAGVLNIVTGEDANLNPLINDSRIAKVCFTGSVNTGKQIAEIASSNLTRLTLELGGNDPALIFSDADLSTTNLDRLFSAIFDTSGQICMNIKRVYVHESRLDELVEGLRSRLSRVKLGHGLEEMTTLGPVHSLRQTEYLKDLVEEARESGALVEQFGKLPNEPELQQGYFFLPTLVINPQTKLRIVTEEQFGPVIPIISFATDSVAILAANDSWAGLGASVWTSNDSRAKIIAQQLVAGYVWINDHGAARLDLRAPFGGMKHSGFGREQGIEGFYGFTHTRSISTYLGDQ